MAVELQLQKEGRGTLTWGFHLINQHGKYFRRKEMQTVLMIRDCECKYNLFSGKLQAEP